MKHDMARPNGRGPDRIRLANRKKESGISFYTSRSLGRELAFHRGKDFGRGFVRPMEVSERQTR